MRRTVGTDLQKHGTMKDAQQILRHANIQTTGNVYMQQIPTSVMEAINSRTRQFSQARSRFRGKSRMQRAPMVSSWKNEISVSP